MRIWRYVLKVSWRQKNHQRRNFEKNRNTKRYNYNNRQKATTFRGSYRKKRRIAQPMHDWYDEWQKRKRPSEDELYISFD